MKFYDKYLILVNKLNKIPDNFNYDLINIYSNYKKDYLYIDKVVYTNYLLLKDYLKKKNINIEIESAYRTHDYQEKLFNDLCMEKGKDYALKYSATKYHSEHETGLAIDICILKNNKYYIEHELNDLKELNIIHNNIYKYGFILRYPKDKESITGYNYEPWHIRYVGKFSNIIYKNNLTLEEFYNLYLKN